jgi:DNA-binding transcriptional ArsR family regulator
VHTKKFQLEERRRQVASMLAQSMTETEIAFELKVDQSTISRDIEVLKKLSQQFVYDLAKSDLAYCYKQCLDGIEEVKRRGWDIFNGINNLTTRDKLLALKLIMECNEAKFAPPRFINPLVSCYACHIISCKAPTERLLI